MRDLALWLPGPAPQCEPPPIEKFCPDGIACSCCGGLYRIKSPVHFIGA
ncbi:hypothetical protein COLSTE_00456 [Collinsella stercoris DSM 13279]|uniref:Uncharacterized protein n=1 Tax=Collinsella stercoris DSM 13279 TaxID=445975 RepID=B6G8R5_9ACTN|nr:hypothetical protein COLSTE_00456 [Collinsella stercoris DSM 13279]